MNQSPEQLTGITRLAQYCQALQQEPLAESRRDFAVDIAQHLVDIYAFALPMTIALDADEADGFIAPSLDEAVYNDIRARIAAFLGEDDTYLETMVEDMRYSDQPIAQTVSENLADLYQDFYDFLYAARLADDSTAKNLLALFAESFAERWGQTLCNTLRALHSIAFEPANEYDEH